MQLFKNNAYSTLAAGLLVGGTTLVVVAGQGDRFPVVSGSDFALVTLQDASNNIEVVKVTARAAGADSMTIVRAQEGTTARAWNIGDIAELRITSAGLAPLQVFAGAATAADMRAAMDVPTRTGGDASGTWNISISGNAATATTLATARTINGTSFNGSANITTDIWGTERTITIGATGKSVNGSAAVSWSLAEIGAAGASDTVNLTGDQTLAGTKTFSSSPVVPGLNGGQLAGMRNKIINGNFQVNQRGYVSGTNVGAANTYTLDRWRVVTSGQNITFTASGNGNLVTAPAGGLEQVIEGINIEGGTYVLNWTGTATATVNGTARAKGESFTLTANANATVRFSSGTVGLVQLEPGTVATPFEHRPFGAELALCQRYCWVGVINLTCSANSTSQFASMGFQPFPSPLRAAPTLSAGSFSSLSFSGVGNGAGLFDGGLTFSSGEATVNGITGLITNNVNSRPQGTTGVFSANANISAEL